MRRPVLKSNDVFEVVRFRQRTKAEREAAWLTQRGLGVGGSDMSTILGVNKYQTPYSLWLEKTGRAVHEDISGRWPVIKGNVLEGELRRWFRRRYPAMSLTDGTDMSLISKTHPCMRASLDGVLWDEDRGFGVLECKTASSYRAADWHADDGSLKAPGYYMAQVTHYLAVTGWSYGCFVADIGESEPVEVWFERDEDDIKTVVDAAEAFWGFIQRDEPPELTGMDVDALYPQDDGDIETTDSAEFDRLSDEYMRISSEQSELKKCKDAISSLLKPMIGERSGLESARHQVTYKTTHYKESVRQAYDARRLHVSEIKEKNHG
ncbi:YqaJ viral recombinase family protein [Bifidobacterium psychraerophilum]|uniref:YqaJ viral recombinase family nuclease n=1 Tax=Bifidobacterium psychraerophilum TaxID=218140 RepID=UPI00311568EA